MTDPLFGTPLTSREFVVERGQYKGYRTEYEFGWVWEITKDDEDIHQAASLSKDSAARNIDSMIKVFSRMEEFKDERSEEE